MHLLDYFMTPSRKFNDVLLIFRRWRERGRRSDSPLKIPRRTRARVVLLAGDLDENPQAADMSGFRGPDARVVGFRFGTRAGAGADARATEFAGCSFPGFHAVLASVLTRVSGESFLALTPGLPGLGLGLLFNFHFGTPLYLKGGGAAAGGEPDWGDPEYLDPRSAAWSKLLARIADRVPRLEAAVPPPGPPKVLPAAREFAGMFAGFYKSTGKPT